MTKPVALVLYEAAVMTSPSYYRVKYAANALGAMGFDVRYLNSGATNPTVAMVNAMTAAVLVIPYFDSINRANLSRFVDASVTKPVFVLGCGNFHSTTKGVSVTPVDSAADFHEAQFSLSELIIWDNVRRYQLDTTLVAPNAVQSLIESTSQNGSSVTGVTPIVAWRYTNGTNNVYYTASDARYTHLPYLIERAIVDEKLSATGIRKIPMFLNIDHINGWGDGTGGRIQGFQKQHEHLDTLAAILRRHPGAVCYANLEQTFMDGVQGTTSGALLQKLNAYGDVFKYIACHSHSAGADTNLEYTTGSTPWTDTYTKTELITKYNVVKALIEGLGLTVNEDFAHHAQNRLSLNWLRIAGRYTAYDSSDDGATEQAGLGFKFVRVGGRTESNPYIAIQLTASESPPTHWRVQPQVAFGVICVPTRDAGGANANTTGSDAQIRQSKFNTYAYGLEQLACGIIPYFHETDFEDAVGGTISDGSHLASYGRDVWDWWSQYAKMCPHTVDFGADANKYALSL